MTLDGCHLCRKPETKQALVGNFLIKELVPDFFGTFDIVLNRNADNKSNQDTLQSTLEFKVQANLVSLLCYSELYFHDVFVTWTYHSQNALLLFQRNSLSSSAVSMSNKSTLKLQLCTRN